MMRSVNGTIACIPTIRSTIESESERDDAAEGSEGIMARGGLRGAWASASTRRPEKTGMNRVGDRRTEKTTDTTAASTGWFQPMAEHEWNDHADSGGSFFGVCNHGSVPSGFRVSGRLHLGATRSARPPRTRRSEISTTWRKIEGPGCEARSMLSDTALNWPAGYPKDMHQTASDARIRSANMMTSCKSPRFELRCRSCKIGLYNGIV